MTRPIDLANISSIYEQTSEFTPSLAVLDDAQALMKIEWNRNEPGEEIPRQYPTHHPHLTFDFNPAKTGLHEDGLYPKCYA